MSSWVGQDTEILESFTCLCSVEQNNGVSRQAFWLTGSASVLWTLSMCRWYCQYLYKRTKMWIFTSLEFHVLHYGCETWTLKRSDAVGDKCLRKIVTYCQNGFVFNWHFLCETVRPRQVVKTNTEYTSHPVVDPADQVVCVETTLSVEGQWDADKTHDNNNSARSLGMGKYFYGNVITHLIDQLIVFSILELRRGQVAGDVCMSEGGRGNEVRGK